MLKKAVENKRLTVAPKVTIPAAPKAREVYLSKEQFDSLVSDKGISSHFYPVLTFLFYQGVRISETMDILWKQIDLDNGVFLPDSDKNKTGNKDPKPLQKETIKALRTIKRDGEYVFEGARSEGGNVAKKFEKAFRAAVLRLGFGKSMWQCFQCRATKNAPAPKPDSPAIACSIRIARACLCSITMSGRHRIVSAHPPWSFTANLECRTRRSCRLLDTNLRNLS